MSATSPVAHDARLSRFSEIEALIEELAVAHLVIKPQRPKAPDFIQDSVLPAKDRVIHAMVQSRYIQLGNFTEAIARRLAAQADNALPKTLTCRGVDPRQAEFYNDEKIRVLSRLPREALKSEADRIARAFLDFPRLARTEKALMSLIEPTRQRLIDLDDDHLDADHSVYELDLARRFSDESGLAVFGFGEMKASGNLDSKNAPDELRHVLIPVLAASSAEMIVKPFGVQTSSSARTSFANLFPPSLFFCGDAIWAVLIPPGMTLEEFKTAYARATARSREEFATAVESLR